MEKELLSLSMSEKARKHFNLRLLHYCLLWLMLPQKVVHHEVWAA
jgi:hypothetical protein